MEAHRYFMFHQKRGLVLGVLQVAAAAVCVICGAVDALFRKDTALSTTRTPVWGGMVMAVPGVLALFASQRKHSLLVCVLVISAGLSCATSIFVSGYSCLTLTYGEEDPEVFHHHDSPEVTFVLHRLVKAANATILLVTVVSLLLSSTIAFFGLRSLPFCGCYDTRTGLETLVPQCDPGETEMVCTYTVTDDNRLFNSPASSHSPERERDHSSQPPYSRLT